MSKAAVLHGFGTSAKQRLPTRLAELAQFGWLPLAAALFGTADWQPQWPHHNFLPVIGLRVHAKIPPSPLSYQQTVSLLGLWERRATLGSQCRALTQAAELSFGLPAAFSTPEDWQTGIKGHVFDVVQCAQRNLHWSRRQYVSRFDRPSAEVGAMGLLVGRCLARGLSHARSTPHSAL